MQTFYTVGNHLSYEDYNCINTNNGKLYVFSCSMYRLIQIMRLSLIFSSEAHKNRFSITIFWMKTIGLGTHHRYNFAVNLKSCKIFANLKFLQNCKLQNFCKRKFKILQ